MPFIPDTPEFREDWETLKRDGFLMSGWNTWDATDESRAAIRETIARNRATGKHDVTPVYDEPQNEASD